MEIITKLFKGSGGSSSSNQIRLINNRQKGPAITYNRRTLFKKFNYRFESLEMQSVAS